MKIINLSPHRVVYFDPNNTPYYRTNIKGRDILVFKGNKRESCKYILYDFPKWALQPPLVVKDYNKSASREIGNLLINKDTQRSRVLYLPDPKPNTLYITSSRTALAVKKEHPERQDIIFPNKLLSIIHDNGTYSTIGTLSFGEY